MGNLPELQSFLLKSLEIIFWSLRYYLDHIIQELIPKLRILKFFHEFFKKPIPIFLPKNYDNVPTSNWSNN